MYFNCIMLRFFSYIQATTINIKHVNLFDTDEYDVPQKTIAEVAPITPKKGVYKGDSAIFKEEMRSPQQQLQPENFFVILDGK